MARFKYLNLTFKNTQMKTKKTLSLLALLLWVVFSAQRVGINTSDPKATLEVKASNPQNPSSTDGFLVPKVEKLNLNLTADQDGMIIFLSKDWIDDSVSPNIIYTAGLYTFDWNHTLLTGNWLKLLASKSTTKAITVFRSLSSGKVFVGDVGGNSRIVDQEFPAENIKNDNINSAKIFAKTSQTETFDVTFKNALENNEYLTIVTLESKGNANVIEDANCYIPGTADFKPTGFKVTVKCSGGRHNLVMNVLVFDLYKGE